jgi:hypothetical protein
MFVLRKKLVLLGICFVSLSVSASLLGIAINAAAEETSLPPSSYVVHPDSVSRSNIWIKGTAP